METTALVALAVDCYRLTLSRTAIAPSVFVALCARADAAGLSTAALLAAAPVTAGEIAACLDELRERAEARLAALAGA